MYTTLFPRRRTHNADDLSASERLCEVCDGFGLVPSDPGLGLMTEWIVNASQCPDCDGKGFHKS